MGKQKNIVIVGGGIAGLTAAYYLQKEINERQLPYQIKLIEASDQLGGKIKTIKKDGYMIERGPDSFLIRKQSAARLVKEVGLEHDLVKNGTGQSFILVKNKLHKMPSGSFMGIPTEVKPFLFSGLFSTKGKLRASCDVVLPRGEEASDQSLGEFFRRRFGDELVDNLVEPLLSGIYAGDINKLSLMATFPNFYQLEQKHRSLIRGLQISMPKKEKTKKPKPGMFYSLKNGLQSLVEAVEEKLEDGTVMKGISVENIERKDSKYYLQLENGDNYIADAVILATPAFAVQKMFHQYKFMVPENELAPPSSVANVALAFDGSVIQKDLEGTGFVVARNSDYRITACTWTHKKWPIMTTPKGKMLLRCFLGKPGDQGVVDLSDQELVDIVMNDLSKLMNITQKPEFSVVTRWANTMPQYTVGHTDRLNNLIGQMKEEIPGVYLAGASYRGIGIPDCIDQGEAAVASVLQYLES